MTSSLLFAVVAAVTGVSALFVVRTADLVRAVMWLALCLLGTAVLYGLLDASFLAGVQVLTYVGGVVTLMVFGVMVTQRHGTSPSNVDTQDGPRGLLVAGGFFAVLATAIWQTDLGAGMGPHQVTTNELARFLLDDQLLAFEVASLLLLAAIIGAVVLARKRDPVPAGLAQTAVPPAPATLPEVSP